ncbi:MAG: DUF692 domain-containing protein [Candidatus Berkiella sp.]
MSSSAKLSNHHFPNLGFGLGLRTDHYTDIIESKPTSIDWFEILTENYLVPGGKPLYYLDQIKEHYPLVMHGVSMSLGSTQELDWEYLKKVKALANRSGAKWISDHVCWTGVHNKNMHDLLPLPYTEECIKHMVSRIKQVQDFLEQPLLIENASTYLTYSNSVMSEWDFLREVTEQADCYLLLDVNNIYVSAFNHQFDPMDYLNGIPLNRPKQIHLAGHTNNGDHIIDTHDALVIDPVWKLYASALDRFGFIPTMIERDDHIPPLNELILELEQAKHIARDLTPVSA